jgi:8-oxo-dGTP pyrophosphatase MutT (NUDIX family)
MKYIMVAGSILPFTIHNGKVYFLFGKENALADTPGFSDFGGGVEGNEDPYQTALREGGEELTGFLGDSAILEKHIKKTGGFYKMLHNTYNIHVIYIDYDENLPKYYNQNHDFLWKRMNKQYLNNTKLFEKIEIRWFSISDMKKHKKEFRNFYQDIVPKIISEVPFIMKHFKKSGKRGKTRSVKPGSRKTSTKSNRSTKRLRGGA